MHAPIDYLWALRSHESGFSVYFKFFNSISKSTRPMDSSIDFYSAKVCADTSIDLICRRLTLYPKY